jgi:thiol peroxidase
MQKRLNAVTFKGTPYTLIGPKLEPGNPAPDFQCLVGLDVVALSSTPLKPRLFSVVPSLDTSVCSLQTKKFEETLAELGDRVAVYTVSLDLPFGQKRFCTDNNLKNMRTLSDVHNQSFGKGYGVLIEGLPLALLSRAVFVVDAGNKITYAEYVPEVATHPNYDDAAAQLRKLL